MNCHVFELIKSEKNSEHILWLSKLDQANYFKQNFEQPCGRFFTEEEVILAADFLLKTRCCNDLDLIKHTDSNHYCLFHLPSFDKNTEQFETAFRIKIAELEKEISAIPYFAETEQKLLLIKYAYDFRHIWFPTELNFKDYSFKTTVNFQSAKFLESVNFENCRFADDVIFAYAKFEKTFNVTNCNFAKDVNVENAVFNQRANFRQNNFQKSAEFSGIEIRGNDSKFHENKFHDYANFTKAIFPQNIYFELNNFNGITNFDEIIFDKPSFRGSKFQQELSFKGCHLSANFEIWSLQVFDKLDFSHATFNGYHLLNGIIFSNDVNFNSAKFPLGIIIENCNFNGLVNFDSAEFSSTTQIIKSKFKGDVSFTATKFNWHTYFDESEFYQKMFFAADFFKEAGFTSTIFHSETKFGTTFFENNFHDRTIFNSTKFLAKADFACSNFNQTKTCFENVDFANIINLPKNVKIIRKKMIKVDLIIHNAKQLVTCNTDGKAKKGNKMQELGIIENGAIAIANKLIKAVGTSAEILSDYESENVIDANQKVVMPAFVDPHTHIIYAGNRLNEFELKIKGADYLEILANGGGILSTVEHTRKATKQELVEQTLKRLDKMLLHGTATVEIKTGYGLDEATEFKMMDVWEELDEKHQIYTVPTFLAAHAVPPEFKENPDDYVKIICDEMLPKLLDWRVNGYLDPDRFSYESKSAKPFFVDVFCEKNAFNLEQTKLILEAAKANYFNIKAHVDEFTNLGGSKLAIELGATSIDHLDAISDEEISLLANSKTVGIVTPTVNFNFGSAHFADARKLIDSGCAIAVSTDYNPGSAPCPSQQTAMQIACRYQKILPSEAIIGTTINAAFSIGLGKETGSLEVGKWADIIILDTNDYREVCYEFGGNFVEKVVKNGKIINKRN